MNKRFWLGIALSVLVLGAMGYLLLQTIREVNEDVEENWFQKNAVETAPTTDQAVRDLQASLQSLEDRLPSLVAQRARLDQLEKRLEARHE